MKISELKNYLYSRDSGNTPRWEQLLLESKPDMDVINGIEVYHFFNNTVDINHKIISDDMAITQQPNHSYIPWHIHNFIELIYIYEGTSSLLISDQTIELHKGDLVLIDKMTPHRILETTREDIVINIMLKKDYLSPAFLSRLSTQSIVSSFLIDSLLSDRRNDRFLIFKNSDNDHLIAVMERIMCEYFNKRVCSNEIINSYLIILFSELIRFDSVKERINFRTTKNNVDFIDFLQYIEENYRDCTLTSMAAHFNFHPNYLSNMLKKCTGKSFKELLQLQKLNKAALFLANSDVPIPDIVDEVGYSSMTFFYKKFKETFHTTPHLYRQHAQKTP